MIDVSCNCTIVKVRNKHIYHNNSHIQVYNAIKSSNKLWGSPASLSLRLRVFNNLNLN